MRRTPTIAAGTTSGSRRPGFGPVTCTHFWDTEFVQQLGDNPKSIASDLIGHITADQENAWAQGEPSDWAKETFAVARDDAYGQLPPPNERGGYRLADDYVTMAIQDIATQLSKSGVRLAVILNRALGQRQ
jgi:S1/P1 Nuclease